MKNKVSIVSLCLLLIILSVTTVFADQRSYVWTYEYNTVERGKAELEHYLTLSVPDIDEIKGTAISEHQIELEAGMNEHFDFSVYQILAQNPNESLKYTGFKLRSRYKIGEKGKLIIDPLVYIEYKGKPDLSVHSFEFKLILAKDIGKLSFSVNPIIEIDQENEEWEIEPEYAIGARYMINELLGIGVEAKGSESAHYIGPVISHGKKNLWVTLGSALKISGNEDKNPEFQIRMILGVEFR